MRMVNDFTPRTSTIFRKGPRHPRPLGTLPAGVPGQSRVGWPNPTDRSAPIGSGSRIVISYISYRISCTACGTLVVREALVMRRETNPRGLSFNLWGHGCIVLAICLLAAFLSFPTGW
jgi:hypothetical protein